MSTSYVPTSATAADLALIEELRLANFSGPRYDAFINDLYRYAWPVMLAAIRTGSIVSIKTSVPHRSIPADELQQSNVLYSYYATNEFKFTDEWTLNASYGYAQRPPTRDRHRPAGAGRSGNQGRRGAPDRAARPNLCPHAVRAGGLSAAGADLHRGGHRAHRDGEVRLVARVGNSGTSR